MTCTCPPDASGPWDCLDCPEHGEAADREVGAQAQAEIDAENGWLRAAEYDPESLWQNEIDAPALVLFEEQLHAATMYG